MWHWGLPGRYYSAAEIYRKENHKKGIDKQPCQYLEFSQARGAVHHSGRSLYNRGGFINRKISVRSDLSIVWLKLLPFGGKCVYFAVDRLNMGKTRGDEKVPCGTSFLPLGLRLWMFWIILEWGPCKHVTLVFTNHFGGVESDKSMIIHWHLRISLPWRQDW